MFLLINRTNIFNIDRHVNMVKKCSRCEYKCSLGLDCSIISLAKLVKRHENITKNGKIKATVKSPLPFWDR